MVIYVRTLHMDELEDSSSLSLVCRIFVATKNPNSGKSGIVEFRRSGQCFTDLATAVIGEADR